jgi:hypothetical protein
MADPTEIANAFVTHYIGLFDAQPASQRVELAPLYVRRAVQMTSVSLRLPSNRLVDKISSS